MHHISAGHAQCRFLKRLTVYIWRMEEDLGAVIFSAINRADRKSVV